MQISWGVCRPSVGKWWGGHWAAGGDLPFLLEQEAESRADPSQPSQIGPSSLSVWLFFQPAGYGRWSSGRESGPRVTACVTLHCAYIPQGARHASTLPWNFCFCFSWLSFCFLKLVKKGKRQTENQWGMKNRVQTWKNEERRNTKRARISWFVHIHFYLLRFLPLDS